MDKLFPHIPFSDDETPLSWAARQAAFHTGGRLVPFLKDLGVSPRDLWRGEPEAIESLCARAGEDTDRVLRNNILAITPHFLQLRGEQFAADFTTRSETQFCPICLKEDRQDQPRPYVAMRHRLNWRLSHVRTCPTHNVPLHSVNAGKTSGHYYELRAMGDAVFEARPLKPRSPSPLQTYIEARLDGKTGPEWLDGQRIDYAVRATELLGALIVFGPNQSTTKMTSDMWDHAGRAGWEVSTNGEAAISTFLTDTISEAARKKRVVGPQNSLGVVYRWLAKAKQPADFPLADIVRNAIVENMPLQPGQSVLGTQIDRPRFRTIASVASRMKVSFKTLYDELAAAGYVDPVNRPTGSAVLIDTQKTPDLVEALENSLSMNEAADALMIQKPFLVPLLNIGSLERLHQRFDLSGKVGKQIDGRQVQEVNECIERVVAIVGKTPRNYVDLDAAPKACGTDLPTLLHLLLSGYLSKAKRKEGTHGLKAVMLDPAEVKDLLRTHKFSIDYKQLRMVSHA